MRKWLSLALSLALTLGLTLPAAAAETADQALSRVTQAVKASLSLDTEAYDDFQGSRYEDGLAGVWSLTWSRTDQELSIQALDDGTIVSYRLGQPYAVSSGADFPVFPQGDEAAAAQSARAFLDRVLGSHESVELGEAQGMDTLGGDSFRFSGYLLLNGLSSPLFWSLTVRAADNQVTSFYRDAEVNSFLGSVPAGHAAVPAARAAEALADTLALRLEYVREEDSSTAVLRYLPEAVDTYYVDAVTGELLNLTELESEMGALGGAGDSAASAEETAADNGGLTEAEQAGIAQLEGVLSTDALDRQTRGETAYSLEDYALSSAHYTLLEAGEADGENQVLCTLYYVRPDEEMGSRSRTIVVDARTGAVESVSSRAPWLAEDEAPSLTEQEAQAAAEAFLQSLCGSRWTHLALYDRVSAGSNPRRPYFTFTYTQTVNGIPFPENAYTVSIDRRDGSVYRLDFQYDTDVTFAASAGIVDMDTALAAWAGTYETTLAYRLIPRALTGDTPAEAHLLELGLSCFYELRLTYALEREDFCRGIDAASGSPVWREADPDAIHYTDLSGSAFRADVEKLAAFGVGYDGGLFQPEQKLTQWGLVALLASLEGVRTDPAEADRATVDTVYGIAYRMGVLTPEERDDGAIVTRGAAVQCLLDCAGYGPAARLKGIFTCNYTDAADIPEEELGYAAIAQGLGLARDRYDGSSAATRGELASMLCRLLER